MEIRLRRTETRRWDGAFLRGQGWGAAHHLVNFGQGRVAFSRAADILRTNIDTVRREILERRPKLFQLAHCFAPTADPFMVEHLLSDEWTYARIETADLSPQVLGQLEPTIPLESIGDVD